MPSLDEKRLELKRLRLQQARDDYDSQMAAPQPAMAGTNPTVDLKGKSLGESAKEAFGDFMTSAEEAVPFSGVIDKIGAANYAAQQKVADLFRDKQNQGTFADRYQKVLDDLAATRQKARERSPIASTAGNVVGGVGGSLAIPIPGAQMAGLGGAAARVGGITAMNALDAATRNKDKVFDVDRAALTAVDPLNAPVAAAAEAIPFVGKAASPVLDWLSRKASNIADSRAVKASGAMLKDFRNMTKGGEIDISSGASVRGKDLRTGDDPIIGWFSHPKEIAAKADVARDATGKQIGEVGDLIDKLTPNSISGQEIAEKIRAYRDKKIPSYTTPKGETIIPPNEMDQWQKLEKEAQFFENMGQTTFKNAQEQKGRFVWKPTDSTTHVLSQDATNATRKAIQTTMDEAALKAPSQIGDSLAAERELIEKYPELKRLYRSFKGAQDTAKDKAARFEANRWVTPSSYGTGLAVGGIAAMNSQDPWSAALLGIPAAALNKVALTRGPAFASRLSGSAANALEKWPQYQRALEAAAKRGNDALAATHYLLMKNDPDYRNLVNQANQNQQP